MRLAAYRTDAFVPTQEMRREMFAGIVSVTFHVGDVAADIVSRHAALRLHLRVLTAAGVYASGQAPAAAGVFRVATPLEVGGAPAARVSAPPERFAPQATP